MLTYTEPEIITFVKKTLVSRKYLSEVSTVQTHGNDLVCSGIAHEQLAVAIVKADGGDPFEVTR